MTDPRVDQMVSGLRERGHDVGFSYAINDESVLRLRLPEGWLRITLPVDGAWEVASIRVPNLDLFMRFEGVPDPDVLQLVDRVAVPVSRAHLLEQVPDQGRGMANGPLSCPVRDGTEVPGGEGAGQTGDSAPTWRTRWLMPIGLWGGTLGLLGFAAFSEPEGDLDPGWALGAGVGSMAAGIGLMLLGVWLEKRRRRRGTG